MMYNATGKVPFNEVILRYQLSEVMLLDAYAAGS